MTAPVLAYHLKLGTALPRTAAWVAVTAVSTLLGVRAMYWMLVNLP